MTDFTPKLYINASRVPSLRGYDPVHVHLFDRWSPMSNIEGKKYYMCGEQHSVRHAYYEVGIAFGIGFEGPLQWEGYVRCPKCWDRDEVAFALLGQLP